MAEPPKLTLVHGGKDMIETLEAAIADVKAGKITGVVLCTVEREEGGEPSYWWRWAHHEDLPTPFGSLLGTITCAQHTLLQEGLS